MPTVRSSMVRCARYALVTALLAAPALSFAADDAWLTGDWGGKRSAWQDAGVSIDLSYSSQDARVIEGGSRHANAHAGQLMLGTRLDLEKLWGWKRTEADVVLTHRDGNELGQRAGLNLLMQNQALYGRGNITRLTRLSLRHTSADGRWDIKAGRLGVQEDFAALDCTAMYLGFCGGLPGTVVGDYWYTWPISQWGARLQYQPDPQWSVRAGVYQINPRYAESSGGGLRLAPSGTKGTLTPVELVWEPHIGGRAGTYGIGGWYSSARRQDALQPLDEIGDLGPMMRGGSYGGWLHAGQKLTGGPAAGDRGLRAQIAYAQSDQRTGRINRMLYGLMTWNGPLPSRPQDQLGAGMAYTWLNPRLSGQMAANGLHEHPEQAVEVFYRVNLIPGLQLQPTLQHIRHAGGIGEEKAVTVFGLKSQFDF